MAAIDVFEHEPMLDPSHPLLEMDNVICTPHLGYVERQQYEGMYGDQIDRLFSYLQGSPAFIVNPEVLQGMSTR
jgi:D-3-phosphoglycerate dehydrogenase